MKTIHRDIFIYKIEV